MFVELHILQNFAPANLNRDDTNSPKTCEFGGYRRARISSQCLKRAIRTEFALRDLMPAEKRAIRTKRVCDELVKRMVATGKSESEAEVVAEAALSGIGLKVEDDGKTQYLLFLGEAEIAGLTDACLGHWDTLLGTAPASDAAPGRAAKKARKAAVPLDITRALEAALNGGRATDLALFGRMLADRADLNVDAAAQVAHALSTNRLEAEFDFYTAVDDLRPEDNPGADMLGTVEFNSACYYRYLNVDVDQLVRNLGDDRELGRAALGAFVQAAIDAVPTGKQNSMAAHNRPSFVFAVVRRSAPMNLANAFVKPVYPGHDGDLVERSIQALDRHWGALADMYGGDAVVSAAVATLNGDRLQHLGDRKAPVRGVIDQTIEAAFA